jgi:hypothetical protein
MCAFRISLVIVSTMIASACGGQPSQLDGSLTAVVDLSYSRVTLEPSVGFLSLRFQRARGEVEDTVLKVGVILDGPPPTSAVTYNLAEQMMTGGQRGTVTRNVLAEPDFTSFPPLMRGELKLESFSSPKKVQGQLSLTFAQGTAVSSGRAVFGTFEAEIAP